MNILSMKDCEFISGGLSWDNNTCTGLATIGGIIIGGALFGWGGAAVGGFAGNWLGDNYCPA